MVDQVWADKAESRGAGTLNPQWDARGIVPLNGFWMW